jgi:hypothetical protein
MSFRIIVVCVFWPCVVLSWVDCVMLVLFCYEVTESEKHFIKIGNSS